MRRLLDRRYPTAILAFLSVILLLTFFRKWRSRIDLDAFFVQTTHSNVFLQAIAKNKGKGQCKKHRLQWSPRQLLGDDYESFLLVSSKSHALPNYYLHEAKRKGLEQLYKGKRQHLVFLHHNKAAGSTVKECLRTVALQSGLSVKTTLYARKRAEWEKLSVEKRARHNVFMGGYTAGVCERLPADAACAYITVLRHPLDRLISSYFYCRSKPGDQLCASEQVDARNVSLVDWAQHQSGFLLSQLVYNPKNCHPTKIRMSCWLQQKKALARKLCSMKDLLRLADWVASRLHKSFAVIGFVDDMPSTYLLWSKALGLNFTGACAGKTVNIAQERYHDNGHTDVLHALQREARSSPVIRDALAADLHIYHKARLIFTNQIRKGKETVRK